MSTNLLQVNTKKNVLRLLEACSNFSASCSEHFLLLAFQCSCGLKPQKYSTFASCGGLRVNSCSAATSCATSCTCIIFAGCNCILWVLVFCCVKFRKNLQEEFQDILEFLQKEHKINYAWTEDWTLNADKFAIATFGYFNL